MVYYALFSSHMSYGCQIWGMSPNAQRIIRLQKSAVRILTFSNFNSHTKPIFRDLKILSLPDLIFLSNIILIYQILNDISPIDICNIFNLHYQSSNHLTRSVSQKQLSRPMVRTTSFGLQSIQYRSILNWNSLQHKHLEHDLVSLKPSKLKLICRNFLLDQCPNGLAA